VCDCVLVNLKLLPVYQSYICTLLWVSCVCYHSCDRFCAVIPAVCNNCSTCEHTRVRCFQDKPLVAGSTEKYMLYWPSSAQPSSWAWSTSECHWWPEIYWVGKHSTRDYSSALSYMTLLHCVSVLYISQTGSVLAQSPTNCFDALTTYNGRWLTGGCWPRSNSFAARLWVYSARSISRLYHRVLTVFQHLASAHLDVLVCSVCAHTQIFDCSWRHPGSMSRLCHLVLTVCQQLSCVHLNVLVCTVSVSSRLTSQNHWQYDPT
jgi:hypothetical protein